MPFRNLKISFLLLSGVLVFGSVTYHFIEGMTYFEGLYMTVITISTVGFGEVRPLSPLGRLITMLIISLLGLLTHWYAEKIGRLYTAG